MPLFAFSGAPLSVIVCLFVCLFVCSLVCCPSAVSSTVKKYEMCDAVKKLRYFQHFVRVKGTDSLAGASYGDQISNNRFVKSLSCQRSTKLSQNASCSNPSLLAEAKHGTKHFIKSLSQTAKQ